HPSPYSFPYTTLFRSWALRVRPEGTFQVVFYQAIRPDAVTDVASPLAYNNGDWHHAAGVLRNGLAELYVDGTLVAQDTTNPITRSEEHTSELQARGDS